MGLQITGSRKVLSEQDLLRMESALGASLPIPYRQFLLSHNGGKPKPDRFIIHHKAGNEYGHIDRFLCNMKGDILDLVTWIKRYKNRIPSDLIPIAVDPGGNLICLSIMGKDAGKVYFWDHENEAGENEEPWDKNIYPVSAHFDEFTESLS